MQDWGERFSGAFVFTDIEGSSLLWEAHGNRFAQALETHNAIISQVCEAHGGRVVNEEGDAFFLAFPDADSSLAFALRAQDQLQDYDWTQHGPDEMRVRMGLHFGGAWRREEDLWGPEVNRAARICEAGHGGQVLASTEFMDTCGEPESEVVITDLGRHRLRGLAEPEHLYQITRRDSEQQEWPALRSLDEVPTNLPAQVTSFVGRERELEQIPALLTDDERRLVPLTGSPAQPRAARVLRGRYSDRGASGERGDRLPAPLPRPGHLQTGPQGQAPQGQDQRAADGAVEQGERSACVQLLLAFSYRGPPAPFRRPSPDPLSISP